MRWHPDKLGICLGVCLIGTVLLPFVVFSPNRIAAGTGFSVFSSLPFLSAFFYGCGLFLTAGVATFVSAPYLRLLCASGSVIGSLWAVGASASLLQASSGPYARIAPGSGFWLATFLACIFMADTITRIQPGPRARLVIFTGCLGALAFLFVSGHLDALSVMLEYSNRYQAFWREAAQHLRLAFGSLTLAVLIGVPLGIVLHYTRTTKTAILNALSILQTIPSMALFGIMVAPLGWLAAHSSLAYDLGIRGIGAAPAFLALLLYSLLPIVANTTAGLSSVAPDLCEAASGMGMTRRQRLFRIELPLALPILLTGIRIVLVQNIGLATIAALIGGGGFGVFIFQGLGQTATDLILLGALPTVALAFVASVSLNILIDALNRSLPQGET